MDKPIGPDPALLVISALYADERLMAEAIGKLPAELGAVRPIGSELDFGWTDYYAEEMGPALKRRFLVAERLVPGELLGGIKKITCAVERELAGSDGRRRINLDPGLVTLGNFVLASTKNNSHRIYLGDGIFAELTLRFVHGDFQALPWTYPDYASDGIRGLLRQLREGYQQKLRGEYQVASIVHRA
jgi:hypothetical protein